MRTFWLLKKIYAYSDVDMLIFPFCCLQSWHSLQLTAIIAVFYQILPLVLSADDSILLRRMTVELEVDFTDSLLMVVI